MKLSCFFTGIVFVLSGICAQAQQYTIPEGVMTYTFPHGVTTYASFPLTADPVYGDAVLTVTPNSISVMNSSAFTGTLATLNAPGAPYFVIFTSGAQVGRVLMVTGNTVNSLTLDTTGDGTGAAEALTGNTDSIGSPQGSPPTTPLFNVAAGDTFEVYSGDTLLTVFGSSSPGGILTGNTIFRTADNVIFPKTTTSPSDIYYFNTTYNYWVRDGDNESPPANANNTVIPPFSSLAVLVRSANPDASLILQGRVADTPLLTRSIAKSTSYNSTAYASDMTLGQISFGPNFAANNTFRFADNIGVYNDQETPPRFDVYYEDASLTWRQYPDATTSYNTVTIHAGSVITILQRASVGGATSFLQSSLPYVLQPGN